MYGTGVVLAVSVGVCSYFAFFFASVRILSTSPTYRSHSFCSYLQEVRFLCDLGSVLRGTYFV